MFACAYMKWVCVCLSVWEKTQEKYKEKETLICWRRENLTEKCNIEQNAFGPKATASTSLASTTTIIIVITIIIVVIIIISINIIIISITKATTLHQQQKSAATTTTNTF